MLSLRVGESVRAGDVVGKVGARGDATGPHLHFEVHVNGAAIDPLRVLKLSREPAQVWCHATSTRTTARVARTHSMIRFAAKITFALLDLRVRSAPSASTGIASRPSE
jgi:hypothetical protein